MSINPPRINKVYINTHKYDFYQAKVCIASVRYWYPKIPIFLIKDQGSGKFSTRRIEEKWNIKVFHTEKKIFGWGYGKLEPLFNNDKDVFLMLDADTVMLGPFLDDFCIGHYDFLVDAEIQPEWRFNQIYYNLKRINEIAPEFNYPGYSFNSGQWIGRSGILNRKDFELTLNWTSPPTPKFPDIVYNGDQAHLNFLLHKLETEKKIQVARQKLMIFPAGGNANFININNIKNKLNCYPYVLHWAGFKKINEKEMPRYDIFKFFQDIYNEEMSTTEICVDALKIPIHKLEKYVKYNFKRLARISSIVK